MPQSEGVGCSGVIVGDRPFAPLAEIAATSHAVVARVGFRVPNECFPKRRFLVNVTDAVRPRQLM
jgi:hypothetical protein